MYYLLAKPFQANNIVQRCEPEVEKNWEFKVLRNLE